MPPSRISFGAHDVETVPRQLGGGPQVAIVEGDDPWGESQAVGAIDPSLALLSNVIGASAADRLGSSRFVRFDPVAPCPAGQRIEWFAPSVNRLLARARRECHRVSERRFSGPPGDLGGGQRASRPIG